MSDVRSKTGAPIADDFVSTGGTPIVVNDTAGSESLSVVNADGDIVTLGMGAMSAPSGTGFVRVTSGVVDGAAVGETGTGDVVRASSPTIATPTVTGAITLASGSLLGTVVARKTGDESITANSTLQNDDNLTFSIGANEEWVVTFDLSCGPSLSITGVKVGVTAPTGATLEVDGVISPDNDTVASSFVRSTTSGGQLAWTIAILSNSNSAAIRVWAWVLNGSTAGSVTLQWAQSTSSATALTFRKGSFLEARRIA